MKHSCFAAINRRFYLLLPVTGVVLLVLALQTDRVVAQGLIQEKVKIQQVNPDTVYYLGAWVDPASIRVIRGDTLIADRYWNFDERKGEWRWSAEAETLGEVDDTLGYMIDYRYRPLELQRIYSRQARIVEDTASYARSDADTTTERVFSTRLTEEALFGDVNLQKSGSLTRGVIVGSNKDLSLESGLRFNVEGQLTEELKLTASLTDQSTPIQPDGSTQNLREFDKVFIRLESDNTRMEMGDVDVTLDKSEFARVNRRLIGVEGAVHTEEEDYQAAFSVARGRFRSMEMSGQDGVQGPYRLTGADGETFITVLAGTEKVYIDGERVNRGADNDYIIDYGIGEITFTNQQIITDETRIVVDFQYINRDFTRSLLASDVQTERLMDGKLTIGASVIREADNDDVRGQTALTPDDVDVLRDAGDDLDQAIVSGIDSVGVQQDSDNILYARVDTTYNGERYTIYRHTGNKDRNVFRIRFSNVGEGEGAYRRVGQAANGILYEWVGPGQGSYAPFEQLPAPQKKQMAAIRSQYRVSENLKIKGEWAVSDFDRNRFSSLDNDDNIGQAYHTEINLDEVETEAGEFYAAVRQRYNDSRFRYFDRAREIEYDRKWNLTGDITGRERLTEATTGMNFGENSTVETTAGLLQRSRFNGRRMEGDIRLDNRTFPDINYNISYLTSEDENLQEDGTWFKQRGRVSYSWEVGPGELLPAINAESEKREIVDRTTDSLTSRSFQFYEAGPSLDYNFGKFLIGSGVRYRLDKKPLDGNLENEAVGITHRYRFNYQGSRIQSKNEIAFRNKRFKNEFAEQTNNRDSKGVFLRSNNEGTFWRDIIDAELLYEANTRRKAILQETYRNVGPEMGQYVWNDLNGDGIQQIDEFFPEQTPNEGAFIKRLIPSDELFPIIDLQARVRTTIEPFNRKDKNRRGGSDWGVLDDLRLQSLFEIDESNRTRELADVYLLDPDALLNDSTTMQGQWFWRQELEWKPRDPIYGGKVEVSRNRTLNRSSVGLQNSSRWYYKLEGRYRIRKRYNVRTELIYETDENINDELSSRNYDISEYVVRPTLEATVSRSYQQNLSASYHWKTDAASTPANKVNMISVETDARVFIMQKLQTNGSIQWSYARMEGESSSLGQFELTNGSGEGSNWSWSIRANYRINQLIRASLNYDGRTVTEGNTIHTVRMVVSAAF